MLAYSTLTNEYHILNADTPNKDFKVFQERVRGLEYSISHYEDQFYIVTNVNDAFNFKLMKTPENQTEISNWIEVIKPIEKMYCLKILIFLKIF